MKKNYTIEELLRKAASFCSISEHCLAEVDEKLKKWSVDDSGREQILSQLLEEDFINEKRYAEAYVKDKFRFNKWGKTKIALNLKSKKIPSAFIDSALSIIDEGEYEEMLGCLLKKKQETIKYTYEYERQGKLFRFAQSRGFEADVIDRVLRALA